GNTYFIRDLDGVDLLKGNRSTNLYTINLHEIASASPICLMARATPTKSGLWHQRLSYLNFDTINDLAKNDIVSGLPKFKYAKEHLCPSCEQGKIKRASHPPKQVPNSKQRLHLLHMDLCGPMRVASINGKWYVLVIVDDYSRYTWVHFLITKDETPEVIKNFLKKIYVRLQVPVIIVRTDNRTEFKNQVLKEYFDSVGITHETSTTKTPQQNGVVKRRNCTLVEAARTMLIFSHAPLFLWAEAIATACYTQNRSIIHRHFNKTPYELIQGRKPDVSYLHVFGALCYPKNDRENIDKLGAKGDIGFFIGYSANFIAYRVYNRKTRKIMETMNVMFDELSAMAFEQNSSRPEHQSMTSRQISSELELTYASSTITPQRPSERDLDILFEPLHNEYLGGRPAKAPRPIPAAPVEQNLQALTASMSVQDSAPVPKNSSNTPVSSHNVDATSRQHAQQQRNHSPSPTTSAADNVSNAGFKGDLFVNPFGTPSTEFDVSSTQYVDPLNMHTFYQPKPDISYLHVFGALYCPKNDREDIGKLGEEGEIGLFIGYSANYVAYIVYYQRTRKIIETMNVTFDELSAMAFEQNSSRPSLQSMTSGQISSELELTYAPSIITPQRPSEHDMDILFEPLHNEYLGGRPTEAPRAIHAAPVEKNLQAPTASMSVQDSTPVPINSSNTPVSSHNVDATSQQHAQ
nr:retrovirus-related Pol polyprotein from transposon TNT 1-94 [Tanacetum cinerariifolium]